jgi:tRNA 2-thiouridine synthesizing protein B
MDNSQLLQDSQNSKMDIFLLTKPPKSDRARLCLQLIARSENAILYLAGDGVYNLLDKAFNALQRERIFACKEDLEARGIQPGVIATMPVDFYKGLLEDIMLDGNRIYTF